MLDYSNKSWLDLSKEANAGLMGQGAVVEAAHRLSESIQSLRESTERSSRTMNRLTGVITYCTVALLVIGILQLAL